ncbi:MAG TPA: thiamine-phosphate kinase [Cyanobacteria bacterium UBA10660]|nr:MAG TPA: thiamine-phosphate kinase [Candidatus Gastranaerophilales bacterium HUM_1]HAS94249.1 thiamine-phosphate kinase [Cyanobacteria bacterium UBA10660]
MKEKEFITIIKNTLNSPYIGDDCAYLKDLGIVVTQDSLVEDIHFSTKFISAFDLGFKAVMVNVSDVVASGAEPKYLTVSLSLPSNVKEDFVEEFYNGCKKACGNDVQIVGGDITGSEKIYISICAIGKTLGRNISSRKNAKIGQKVIVSGIHGSSSAGLKLLLECKNSPEKFIKSHINPVAQVEFGKNISTTVKEPYAMMDTSDGLMDGLSTIANESGVLLDVDFDKIPYDKDIEQFENWQDLVLFGGEDYQILATVPQNFQGGFEIGVVKEGLGVNLKLRDKITHYSKQDVEEKVFNHFKD